MQFRVRLFFLLTFALSWLLWLPSLLRSTVLPGLPAVAGLPGMFAPFAPGIVAFALTARAAGRAGVRQLARRGVNVGFDRIWWLPTLLLLPLVAVLTVGGGRLLGWEMPAFPLLAQPLNLIGTFFFIFFLGGPLGEEFGWRGYALEPMQRRWGALGGSLGLGLLWGLWHLPLHFIEGTAQQVIPVWQFVAQQIVLAVLYTWLFNHTRGSVLVAMLFHAMGNLSGATLLPLLATNQGRWLNFGLLLAVAIVIVVGERWSLRPPATANPDGHKPIPTPPG